ncbi:MAG: NADH-quinone oxidoreductase subunit I [Desulfobulbaceae bacterium]|nr:NADH-quinone oxidoreductase subunit I [Desulfobulbaceae bacterium]
MSKTDTQASQSSKFSVADHLKEIVTGFVSLLKGMKLTFGYLISPKKVITQQYPENRETLKMFPRFRGRLKFRLDEEGRHLCTACSMCERACPNGTISVLSTKDENKRKVLAKYVYRLNQCTLCNLCVESCPFGALEMGHDFEMASYDRDSLVFILNQKEQDNDN